VKGGIGQFDQLAVVGHRFVLAGNTAADRDPCVTIPELRHHIPRNALCESDRAAFSRPRKQNYEPLSTVAASQIYAPRETLEDHSDDEKRLVICLRVLTVVVLLKAVDFDHDDRTWARPPAYRELLLQKDLQDAPVRKAGLRISICELESIEGVTSVRIRNEACSETDGYHDDHNHPTQPPRDR